jgi:hypothetical protein
MLTLGKIKKTHNFTSYHVEFVASHMPVGIVEKGNFE